MEYSQILLFKQYSPHSHLEIGPTSFTIHSFNSSQEWGYKVSLVPSSRSLCNSVYRLRGHLDFPWEGQVFMPEATRVQYTGIHHPTPSDVCNSRCCLIP